MKKILAVLLVGVLVVSIPAVSSLRLPKMIQKQISITNTPMGTTDVPEWADGNITGVYAMKNETTGYDILGNVFGYYHIAWGACGYYAGVWETLDGNTSGYFAGWFFFSIALGEFNITGNNETGGFIGLIKINESDMTIKSVSLAYNEEDCFVRYALCEYTKFE
jgi:hypothetical protein